MARFVALGDSLTEGVGDPHPAWPNGWRGWADLVAAALADRDPSTDYANLALRGRTARDMAEQQLPAALAMKPDIVSIWAGGNDILRPRLRLDDVLQPLDQALAQLAATATVIVFTGFEVSGSPVLAPLRARVRALNADLCEIAGHRGALVADVSERGVWRDPRLWAGDRVHPSPLGHRRLAVQVSQLLGVDMSRAPDLEPAAPSQWARVVADEAEWWRVHAAPHLARWATGASRRELAAPKWSVPVRPAATFPWFDVGNDLTASSASTR
ncbi:MULTISPECIES: SGNH/GDSL hydrolase family protein [unclassified Knoellia]|uniref:SGNH/GDSL hydrolase family protein n=1 Tax=Knoellia altitudinis TaxID=3404795 RepID=UPI003617CE42